jgi:diamine N-acetyltransferase
MVRLEEVTADNWRRVAAVKPRPDQRRYVAEVTYYLCLCAYGGIWHPLAIVSGNSVVGHVMWGVDEDGSRWIGGLVVDATAQRKGIGRAAMRALVERLAADPACTQVALSYRADNPARGLYAGLGFVETGELDDGEVVARLATPRQL